MTEYDEYTYLSAAFFFLHIINVYEDKNHLIIDICCYENADMLKCMTIEALEVCFIITEEKEIWKNLKKQNFLFRMPNRILII